MATRSRYPHSSTGLNKDIRRLAIPAFLTLIAEPIFLLADAVIIGHLGTTQLAGLGVASAVLSTASGVFVFLAYSSTAVVARRIGAGKRAEAISGGIDGVWLALLLGILTGLVVGFGAGPISTVFGASPEATAHAVVYLQVSSFGIPAMLLILALTGVLRGVKDTRTPLIATTLAFSANIVLNVLFVYGMNMGIGGAALGTVLSQTGLAAGLATVVLRAAHREKSDLRPRLSGVLTAAAAGSPLLVRTIALRATMLVTTWVAAQLGDVPIAAYQLSSTIWTFLAFAMDALAIAGQALVGQALGAGERRNVRDLTTTLSRLSLKVGAISGAIIAVASPLLPALFTPDQAVRDALTAALIVIAVLSPVAGFAYLLDGVLIGAGDGPYLARTQVILFFIYLPLAWVVYALRAPLMEAGAPTALAALWVAFSGFMTARALLLRRRARTDAWMTTGA